MRPFVLCADDYGMNDGISRGVLALARAGRVSATSAMTNAPAWPDAAGELRGSSGGIGVGLHLTLTWGRPLGSMPRLAPDGRMPPLSRVVRLAFASRLPIPEIAAEIERQLDSFEAALGRLPDFVDGHQHVHVLPGIRASLLQALANRCGRRPGARRPWLRDPSDRIGAMLRRRLAVGKAVGVTAFAAGFARQARRSGFPTNEGFSGFSTFDPGRDLHADMARHLTALGRSPVVMCHPGYGDLTHPSEHEGARQREQAYLASDDFAALLVERGLVLAPAPALRPAV